MSERERSSGAHRLPALDLLRLFAALSVVLFHYAFRGAAADGYTHVHLPELIPFAKYGARGVSLFFVISGFVIAYSAVGRSTQDFAIARITRLYPGFLICMSLTFAITLLFGMPPISASLQQWMANLAIASPALGQPYMDGAYWSIVTEVTFYAWMAVFIATGLFPRYLVQIMSAWLAASLLNMTVLHSGAMERLLLTEVSGFFIAGVLLYAIHFRRSSWLNWTLLVTAALLAADQTIESSFWSHDHYSVDYSNAVNASLCVGAVTLVGLGALVKRLPFNASLVAALGGLTYPLYLLHQHVGYIIFNWSEGLLPDWLLVTAVTAMMLVLSWAIWRFVEPKGQRLTRHLLSSAAARVSGWRQSSPMLDSSPASMLAEQEDMRVPGLG